MGDPRYDAQYSHSRRVNKQYLDTQVQVAGRLDRLIMTYDAAIQGAEVGNKEQVRRALELLINSLNFDVATEFGIGMLSTYKYCLAALEKEDYKAILHNLSQLRDAWHHLRVTEIQAGSDSETTL